MRPTCGTCGSWHRPVRSPRCGYSRTSTYLIRTTAASVASTTSSTSWRRRPAGCWMRFVKRDPAPLEAAGLRWLAEAGARVPEILDEQPGELVLARIDSGRLTAAGEEDLGRMLAGMHRAGAPHFGSLPAPGRFFVGMCELESPEGDDWNDY